MNYRIGIDVGGTNTDAVLLDNDKTVIARTKQSTTSDVITGIEQAIASLLKDSDIDKTTITEAMLGTTHCTNAIVERKGLNSVVHFRLGAPATLAIPPLTDVPDDFRNNLAAYLFIVKGGFEYDGRILSPLDEEEIRGHLRQVKGKVDVVSVCGVFSPVSNTQELRVAELVREELGEETPISLSYEIGSIGLLERENASILNAALFTTARNIANGFSKALLMHQINAEIFFGQNDGTLMPLKHALSFPILTIASGPTNSIRGASYLTGLKNALVVDVGGTTTDVGVLTNGFPRESLIAAEIGGVRTNFRMPDIASIGLGGGTIVTRLPNGEFKIGPESVGYKLVERALVFGGDTITVTDIAVAKGLLQLGDSKHIQHLPADWVEQVFTHYVAMVEKVIDRMKTNNDPTPVVLVGGGAVLLPNTLQGASQVIRPENASVANAIGISVAQASGEVDILVVLNENKDLNAGLEDAQNKAIMRAIAIGAQPDSIETIELEAIPLAYMPGNAVRIRAKVAGTLATTSKKRNS